MRAIIQKTTMTTDNGEDFVEVEFSTKMSLTKFKELLDKQHFREVNLEVSKWKQETLRA